jgi:ribosomal protein S6
MASLYDLTLMLDPGVADDRRAKIRADVEAMIGGSGEIVGKHEWGTRKMAFEIDHKAEAEYHLIQFTGGRELLEQLNRSLHVTDGVVRYRIIKLKAGGPAPATPASVSGPTAAADDAPATPAAAPAAPAEAAPAPAEAPTAGAEAPAPAEAAAPAPAEAPAEAAPEAPAEEPEAAPTA